MRKKVSPIKLRRPTVPVVVDGVVIHNKKIMLIKRAITPYKEFYVIPGGFVIPGETTKEACIRELKEETGLDVKVVKFIGIYDSPSRDPRGHTISVAYLCKSKGGKLKSGYEAKDIKFFSKEEIKKINIGFDHKKILKDAGAFK